MQATLNAPSEPVPKAFSWSCPLRLPLAILLLAALPAFAEDIVVYDPELPEGYPPKMGDVFGALGGETVVWETFDFSIGAFDASAWIGAGYETPEMTFHLMAYAPGEPDTMAGRFHAEADFGAALHIGEGENVVVSIMKGDDMDGPRLSSEGQPALLVIDSIGPDREDSYNRRVTGRIEAQLCPIDWKQQSCQDLVLTFDTDMQLETTVVVQE
jgi:hypothetical protein